MKYFALLIILFLGSIGAREAKTQSINVLDSIPFAITHYPIAEGLRIPWGIVWGPDNWLWVTERYGRVSRINPETGEQITLLRLGNVAYTSPISPEYKKFMHNSGLLDIALDPAFSTNHYVYLLYAKQKKDSSYVLNLSRFTYTPDTLTAEKIIFDKIPGFTEHDAGRLLFDQKGKLFITTGDSYHSETSQDDRSLNGKILRINTDGTIPNDNPNPKSYVWAKGFRDPQGIAWGKNGTLYNSDHGPFIGDKVNILKKGGNYGWPNVEGNINTPQEEAFDDSIHINEPIWYWTPTLAPGGIAYYNNPEYRTFDNSIFVAFLKGARLIQLELDRSGQKVIQQHEYLKNEYGRLRSLCVAPDGRIFVTTSNADRKSNEHDEDDKIIVIIIPK
jgi:glucose/arabinose dehydrogenase